MPAAGPRPERDSGSQPCHLSSSRCCTSAGEASLPRGEPRPQRLPPPFAAEQRCSLGAETLHAMRSKPREVIPMEGARAGHHGASDRSAPNTLAGATTSHVEQKVAVQQLPVYLGGLQRPALLSKRLCFAPPKSQWTGVARRECLPPSRPRKAASSQAGRAKLRSLR